MNSAGVDGLFYGNPMQFVIQAKAAGIVAAYTFAVTIVILKVVGLILPLRASEDEEKVGLDISEHREAGYTLID